MSERRTIVVGDVHGCLDELQELLKIVAAEPSDRLISVGDLLCKGPDTLGVMEWAMATPNLECVLGNYELGFLDFWRKGTGPSKPHDVQAHRQLGGRYEAVMRYVSRWPISVSGPGLLVVHAGFDPRRPLEGQPDAQLANIRRLPDTGEPWYERYSDPRRLVAFGHWARPEPVVRENAIGLDTGCVYGGALTALVLPERRLVSVRARHAYQPWPAAK